MDSKWIQYRARKLARERGITEEAALGLARQEVAADGKAVKEARQRRFAERSKRAFKAAKASRSTTLRTATDALRTAMKARSVPHVVVSGGAFEAGKKK